jgi:hypothetical protein
MNLIKSRLPKGSGAASNTVLEYTAVMLLLPTTTGRTDALAWWLGRANDTFMYVRSRTVLAIMSSSPGKTDLGRALFICGTARTGVTTLSR